MSKMSTIDKLKVILDVTQSSKLYIVVILMLIALGLGLSMSNPKNQIKQKLTYIILTIFIVTFSIFSYHSSLGKMLSYMMDNLFVVIFFPNLAVYLVAIIITNIILWISIFSFKSAKPIRNLNIIVYSIMTYLMLLILNVINENKLDIFSQESIYGNKQVSALIDISSFIFVLWIIFLVVYKIILIYLKKNYAPNVKKVVIKKKVKILPENYQPLNIPDYVYGTIRKNNKVSINEQSNLKELESRFTLEDYKLFSKILKEEKCKLKEYNVEKDTIEESIKDIMNEEITEPIKNGNLIAPQIDIEAPKVVETVNRNIIQPLEDNYTYQAIKRTDDKEKTFEQPKDAIENDCLYQDYAKFNEVIEPEQDYEDTNADDYEYQSYADFNKVVEQEEDYLNPINEITNFDDKDDNKLFVEKDYKLDKDDQERENNKYTELELLYRGIH